MNQLLSTLRFSAILLAMIGTAHATTPGTITLEGDEDTVQQEQGDEYYEEDSQDQNDQDDGYYDDQDQDRNQDRGQDQGRNQDRDQGQEDDWGDDQGNDPYERDDRYDRDDRGQNNDSYERDDRYDRGQGGKKQEGKKQNGKGYERPEKPGRGQGKPGYDRRPRRLVERVNVYRQYFGGARLPLAMMVNNLERFAGYRLTKVILNGSSDAGMGMATFCSSECTELQNVGFYRTSYPIFATGERVNPSSNQWFLELRGNFWVESIQLEFVR